MFYRQASFFLLACLWFFSPEAFAQDQRIADSLAPIYLRDTLPLAKKLSVLSLLAFNEINDVKKGLAYAEELIRLAEKSGNETYLRDGYFQKGTKQRLLSQHAEALAAFFKSAEIARKTHYQKGEGEAYGGIADIYAEANNFTNAIPYYNKAITTLRESGPRNYLDSTNYASILSNAGDAYRQIRRYDSALIFSNEAKDLFSRLKNPIPEAYTLGNIGMIYVETGRDEQGERNLQKAMAVLEKQQHFYPVCVYLLSLADVNLRKGDLKAAFGNAEKSLHLAEQNDLNAQIRDAHLKLSQLNEKAGDPSEALAHYKEFIVYRDSISNNDVERKMTTLRHNYDMAQKQSEMDALNKEKQAEKKLTFALAAILGLTIFLLAVLFRNIRIKQKAYKVLNLQKLETDRQKAKTENALLELQVTQRQLVQSAKMASLGELTAGIAHEIQNPLNFVNNFSEVSVELLDELKEGIFSRKTDAEKTEAIELFNNLTDNLRKVRDHGKRADSIVKGMLQHSTATTGKKEPTNLNALADEYLRLSFHGLRAKDKSFTANFDTSFDENIGLVDLVPQDIGRVLLNFYNNAFYSVNEKRKKGNSNYEPLVSVCTKRIPGKVLLSVKDNGTGIPPALLDKVFQPFFTTKPAGQGTGLGLSLSYDIIKAHGGELTVNTKEGEFAEFVIELPAANRQPGTEQAAPTVNTVTNQNA